MYTVPFTEDSVREEICGRSMNVRVSYVGSPIVQDGEKATLQDNGSNWSVENGVIHIKDDRGVTQWLISGVEVVAGKVALAGECLRVAGKTETARIVMHEESGLGTNFHIVVSSHVDYEEKAVPKLVRSLAMEGIPEDRVMVVVAGASGEITKEKGYTRVPVDGNLMGLTALLYLMDEECSISSDYVVLLHDTCEAVSGCEDAIKSIDVGLPFDVITAWHEIGVWSMNFMRMLSNVDGLNVENGGKNLLSMILELGSVISYWGYPKTLKSRDVYGGGVKRIVYDIPQLGVKKYAGRDRTGGRP